MSATNSRLIDAEQVGEMLGGVPTSTLAIWRSTRRYNLPFVKIGRLVRYRESDVLKFIEQRTVKA